jgi:cyclohexanone monooxygenase
LSATYVVIAAGSLDRPKLPGIPGIDSFTGHTFHTSRWDYSYTGGDRGGNLTGLSDKRVGVIGTGASAIQCVPYIAADAEHLYVFQRTPSTVGSCENPTTDPEWVKTLRPGWQRARMSNFLDLTSGVDVEEDLVQDAWTDIFLNVSTFISDLPTGDSSPEEIAASAEIADIRMMASRWKRIDATVQDHAAAEALKAYYPMFCKRPGMSATFLPTFNRSNVTLVSTDGRGVDRITETGVVVGDAFYEVDCLIFATGFETGTSFTGRQGYDVVGRDGVRLSEKWAEGFVTFHGLFAAGFPNMFFLGNTQTGLLPNSQHFLLEQAEHVAHVVAHCRKSGVATVEASEAA